VVELDEPQAIVDKDTQEMLGHILALPGQVSVAWKLVEGFSAPAEYSSVDAIVVLGMGGSAIGGDLVRAVVAGELKVPMVVVRDYELPAFVGPSALVIASSHSGETEETLTAFEAALARGAKGLVISTGGTLLKRARTAGLPAIQFDYPSQPRAALGYSATLLLGVLDRLGLVSDKSADVAEAVELLSAMAGELGPEVPEARNPAKQLARFVEGKVAVFYGGALAEVARRWKGQLNENAKTWAHFEAFPELDHNAVVGYQDPAGLKERLAVVMLSSDHDHPRTRLRLRVTGELMDRYGIPYRTVAARGKSYLAQVLSAGYVGDFASYYLAALYGVDPTPIEPIVHLKAELAGQARQ
jgi:glucose/mannose-6-phosphate isomerase